MSGHAARPFPAPPECGASLTGRLASRLAREVNARDRQRALVHLLDWLGCVAGARRMAPGVGVIPPLERAGLAASLLEMDDVHRRALLHPGPVVWTALFLDDEAGQRPLSALLDAAVRGYEAMIALGEAMDAHHYAHWHPTATMGGAGGAAALASLNDGRPQMLADAMGHALSLAGGLWRTRHEPGTQTKQVHVLAAAQTGRLAAAMARAGARAPSAILEGEQGLFAAMTRQPRPALLLEERPEWRIHEVSLKPWPACRHCHPAIDAALALARRGAAGPEADGEPILVATYDDALRFADCPEPQTSGEMRFSLQHGVAVALVRGGAMTVADFDPEGRGLDPLVQRLRRRVRVVADPELSARYPGHFGARASCGGVEVAVDDALGDPERPMSADARRAKLTMLAAHGGLGAGEMTELAAELSGMASGEAVISALQRWLA